MATFLVQTRFDVGTESAELWRVGLYGDIGLTRLSCTQSLYLSYFQFKLFELVPR